MATSQNKLIITLAIVLALVVAISFGLIFLLPSNEDAVTHNTPDSTTSNGQVFDLKVLQRTDYQQLNKQLVQEGALPVQPPANTGKINPFL